MIRVMTYSPLALLNEIVDDIIAASFFTTYPENSWRFIASGSRGAFYVSRIKPRNYLVHT